MFDVFEASVNQMQTKQATTTMFNVLFSQKKIMKNTTYGRIIETEYIDLYFIDVEINEHKMRYILYHVLPVGHAFVRSK
jgi:hypothetical protein